MVFSPVKGLIQERLPNGLRLYLKPDRAWPLVSLHAWVRVGSVDEASAEAGISHILEHMVFKGTAHHRAEEISRWVESLGGAINAETAKEYTHYYIDVPAVGARKAVHLLGELLCRASIDPAEWAREKPVILEEIKRRNDDPDSLLWDLLNEALFRNPAWRRAVIGTPDTVAAVSAQALQGFYRRFYVACQCTVVIAGDFDPRQMRRWVEAEFRPMPPGRPGRPRPVESASGDVRQIRIRKAVRQCYAAFGFPTPPGSHADHEALDLLSTILGDGRGARLVNELREEKKLVWSVNAANLTHDGPGLFAVFVECDPSKRAAMTRGLQEELRKLKREPPAEREIERAKNMVQTAWLQGLESTHNQASTLGLFAMEDNLERLDRYLPRILSLTRRELIDVVNRYFSWPLAGAVIQA